MLSEVERIRNYEWQNRNRGAVLTRRQERRVNHKRRHQQPIAERSVEREKPATS